MYYTIARIVNPQTTRAAVLDADGNKATIWICEEGRKHNAVRVEQEKAYSIFLEFCEYVTRSLYSYEQLCEMLDQATK